MKMLKTHKDLSFGTSKDNANGLKLELQFEEDTKTAYGEITLPEWCQGHNKDEVHPGIISVMLDEVMTHINRSMGIDARTGELTVRYLQEAKVKEPLYLRGFFVRRNKRTIENRAELEDDLGKIVARAKGKYIESEEM
ncbi:MAG: PaaI family thioesterase [Candidatus Hydrogenedentota bacterium]|nr:MAG: PaaI family thioesterase [Candidatus Hydrogenedentota bacterium]